MSENQNRGNISFAQYDSMATEELEEILRLDAEMSDEEESDIEKILYIMEVLAERKSNNGHTGKTALEAYESFEQHYMPKADNNIFPIKSQNKTHRWVRKLAATAAVLALLLVGSATAKAFGFDLWKAVIQWTQETLQFGEGSNSDPYTIQQFDSLQDALEEGNAPGWLVPTWIPDGYEIENVTAEQSPKKKTYTAIYTNEEKSLKIVVRDYFEENPIYVEQSDGLVEEYTASGITYYLFENNEQIQAVWIVGSYECGITGKVTMDELKQMINSIEKG